MDDLRAVPRTFCLEPKYEIVSHFTEPFNSYAFPVNDLDPIIVDLLFAVQNKSGASTELIASTVFAAMSLACQDVVDVNPINDLMYPTSAYYITCADSGELKSTVFRIVNKPFHEKTIAVTEQYQRELEQYERDQIVWKSQVDGLKSALRQAAKKGTDSSAQQQALDGLLREMPLAPAYQKKWLFTDVTRAAVKHAIASGGGSTGIWSDESTALFKGDLLQEPSFLNSAWSGDPAVALRASSPKVPTVNQDYRVSLNLMLQRQPFEDFLDKRGRIAWESGFLARCLYCNPPVPKAMELDEDEFTPLLGHHQLTSNDPIGGFYKTIYELLDEGIQRGKEGRQRRCLTLCSQGEIRWKEMYKTVMKKIEPAGEWHNFRGFGSKFMEHVSRLAAVLECFTTKGPVISIENLESAIALVTWYFHSMANKMSCLARPEAEVLARILDDWFIKQAKNKNITIHNKNDLLQKGPEILRNKRNRDIALEYLAERGWVQEFNADGKTVKVRYNPNTIHVGMIGYGDGA